MGSCGALGEKKETETEDAVWFSEKRSSRVGRFHREKKEASLGENVRKVKHEKKKKKKRRDTFFVISFIVVITLILLDSLCLSRLSLSLSIDYVLFFKPPRAKLQSSP